MPRTIGRKWNAPDSETPGLKNKIPIDWCPIPYRHKPKIKHQTNRYIFYNFIIRNILSVAPALPFTNCPALSPAASSTS